MERRTFLRRGGLVAGGAALGAAAMTMAPAGAQATGVQLTYFPVGPYRAYDSRQGSGAMVYGETRVIETGLHALDPAPIAITVNVTVTHTRGRGWIAVWPSDAVFDGTSSVNWFGDDQDLANNTFAGIAPDGVLNFTCGGIESARAEVVIDFIGASVAIDYGSAAAAQAIAAYGTPWTEANRPAPGAPRR